MRAFSDERMRRLATEISAMAAVTGVAFLQFFPHRSDYAGHYLAGLGGTLMMLGGASWLTGKALEWWAVALCAVAVMLGVLTESTIFRIGIFDPVDFFNQSLGAVVAALLMVGTVPPRRSGLIAFVLGAVTLVMGFILAFT